MRCKAITCLLSFVVLLGAIAPICFAQPPSDFTVPPASEFDLLIEPEVNVETDPRLREPTLREIAADSLGRIGRAAVPSLVKALSDADPAIRQQAARALGRIGPEASAAVAPLARALKDSDRTVRVAATRALGQIGPAAEEAIPALIESLRAPDDLPSSVPTSSLRSHPET